MEEKGIEVTLEQIIDARESIENFMRQTRLPIKRSYWLGKCLDVVIREIKRYDREYYKLLEEYGEVTKDGKRLETKPENVIKFNKEIQELKEEKVTLDLEPLDLTLYEKDKNGNPVETSVYDIWAFYWLFKDPGEPELEEAALEAEPEPDSEN